MTTTSFSVGGTLSPASCTKLTVLATASSCSGGATPLSTYYCPIADSFEAGNYNITGQIPQPTNSSSSGTGYFLSTIASISSSTQVILSDTIPWPSGSFGSPLRAVWGTDKETAEANLVPTCQALATSNNNSGGCDIFIDPPGSPGSPTGLYLSSATWNIPTGPNNPVNSSSQGNILIRGPGSQKIQNAGGYANGLTVTNDSATVSLAMLGRDYVVTVGTPNILTQGFSAINIGLADPTASSANQGTSPGGFHLQAVAGVHIMNSSGYQFSGGAGIHTDGIGTSTQSVEIDSWDCLACYYSEALLPGSVDIKIEGGESSGLGAATTSLIPSTPPAPQGSIGILEEYANTVRVHLTDLQNFSTAGIYCYNSKNCINDSTRHEQVGETTGITGSSAVVIDGTSSTNCLGFVVDKPQIASGFQYAVTVTSSCGNGLVSGNFNAAPLNILNNGSGIQTVVEGYDSHTPSSYVTSVQLAGDLGNTAVVPYVTGLTHVSAQSRNTVFAGPASGSSASPTFRSLVGADLPNPSATALGGVQSFAPVTSEWINTISTAGVPGATQPTCANLSGVAPSCSAARQSRNQSELRPLC